MTKCICKQIAELVEKNGCDKVHVCTNHAGICGYVDVEATKSADGILVLKNAKIKYDCGCEKELKMVDCLGIAGRHIATFHCGEFEV